MELFTELFWSTKIICRPIYLISMLQILLMILSLS